MLSLTRIAPALLLALAACSGQPADESRGSQPPSETTPAADAASPEAEAKAKPAPAAEAALADAKGDPAADAPAADAEPTPAAPPDLLATLTDDQRALLLAGDEDDPLEVEIHYIQSNETRHDLFFPYVEGIGGAFIGVGSDQSFTMAAAAEAELMFMLDIDRRVVELQKMYAVLIPQAESARDLVDMFQAEHEDATAERLSAALSDLDESDLRRMLNGFRTGRETVYRHLERVISRDVDGQPASWLSDPEMFAHIQKLYRAGRVRMMVGNLAGDKSMRTVGKACEALGVPVRVLYMSNAEEYFKYTDDFRANIAALPLDDDTSMVLRTIYSKKWEHADLWAYQVQPLLDFRTRLEDKANRSRNPMLRLADNAKELDRTPGPKGLSLVALSARG